ncbi:MAG: DUF348 domain-containing protein [Dehalococcoidia bacterium]|nr:DUF348 domain-containing protein [Dehalococcoidia bacterium]
MRGVRWQAARAALSGLTSGSVLLDPRRRRHLAMLSVAIAIAVFVAVLLQPRKVRVQADGRETVVTTWMAKDSAVLRGAGVELRPGDRVTALRAPGADVLRVERAHRVLLLADGARYELLTHARTIDQLLAEASEAIDDRDSVVQDGELVSVNAPIEPPRIFAGRAPGFAQAQAPASAEITIAVRRAMPFRINEDGRMTSSSSSQQTVAEALREAGVVVGPGDAVTPPENAALQPQALIDIRHARSLTVTLPNDHRVLYTLAATVGDALSAAGIAVPAGAFTEPSLETPVTAGMSVRVVQLSASRNAEREYIASGTVYKPDPKLAPGQTRTVAGRDGARVREYDVSYVDGREAGRTLVREYFDPAPVDTVVYYPVRNTTAQPAPASRTGGTLRVYATWYTAASSGRAPSDPAYGRTATGVLVTYGIVAVDPNVIPLGTKMFIPGYGYAVAADTGGAVKGYVIDLGFPDGVQVDWQSRWIEITIVS